ncbi:ROK family transcriptional regulator [Arthrobacter sp. W4I7]|uniref:ROK family transcriptional regulator n=1 Tax=Arthrobacter sp. W4I7 TaxID=3042296 RepID=UPI002787F7CA|nr:ROK family transcriptional regulator [Arthrobacter sp. W4I7]MDQ0693152.1 putative NBD/HSP70 family sugar kinase/biotin operon repressor [Arthrobacter sp. W4I7]
MADSFRQARHQGDRIEVPAGYLTESGRTVLASLIAEGFQSRPGISKMTGLSKQTVSLAIAELESLGFVEVKTIQQGHTGRAAVIYEVAAGAGWTLGIDMGSTHIRVAASTLTGFLIKESEYVLPDAPNTANALFAERAGSIVKALISEIEPEHGPLRSACVALSRALPEFQNWQGLQESDSHGSDLPDIIRQIGIPSEIPVYAENNVNCAALGELRHGDARGLSNIAFLQIGVGIGAGIITSGVLLRGANGQGGELRKLRPFPIYKGCGDLQDILGAAGLLEKYNSCRGSESGKDASSAEEVFARAQAGSPAAQMAIRDEAEGIAFLATVLVAAASPELLVLGGGIGRNENLLPLVKHGLAEQGIDIALSRGHLGSAATVAGAAALAAEQYLKNLLGVQFSRAITSYEARWSMLHR